MKKTSTKKSRVHHENSRIQQQQVRGFSVSKDKSDEYFAGGIIIGELNFK